MYYLTVLKGKEWNEVVASKSYEDFGDAMEACADFYSPKTDRAVLTFTTETINGKFARAYAELNRPEDIDIKGENGKEKHQKAVKHSNAHTYGSTFLFLIESDLGVADVGSEASWECLVRKQMIMNEHEKINYVEFPAIDIEKAKAFFSNQISECPLKMVVR